MKLLNKISFLIFLILTLQFLGGCGEGHDIEIIQADDPGYLPFDSVETLSPEKEYKARLVSEFLGDLYSLSNRGRNEFDYELFLNKSGKCEKIRIVKGLGEAADQEVFRRISENNFKLGIKNDTPVKYKTNLNNKWLFGVDRDFSAEQIIKVIQVDDADYFPIDKYYQIKYIPHYIFKNYPITDKIIRYNKEKIVDTFDSGTHAFFYKLFVNEKGRIDKVRIIKGMSDELDEILMSDLPLAELHIITEKGRQVKYTFIWNLLIRINDDSRITFTQNSMIFSNIDENTLVNIESREIEIIDTVDTSYAAVGSLDQYSADWPPYMIIMSNIEEKLKPLYEELGEGEYRFDYVIHINEIGLVDKVKIEKGMGEKYDKYIIEQLSASIFYRGEVNGSPTKYRGVWSYNFNLDEGNNVSWSIPALVDSRFTAGISNLPEEYTEKDFAVLPSVLPHPVGGVRSIAEKVIYPDVAKNHHIQGRVLVKTYVDENGNVIGVQTLGGIGYDCEKAAIKAIKETKFEPAFQDGKAVKSYLVIPVEFSLSVEDVKINKEDLPIPYQETFAEEFINDEDFILEADITPFPVGGLIEIQKKIVYPEAAKKDRIQGKVFINAFVNSNGDVVKAEVIRGIGGGCDEAALNAVEQTKFSPGFRNGQPVNMQITVPIMFKLK
jgi:TonB family protein